MATNNHINNAISGQSGTGSLVGVTSPTLVTPTLGAATATSLTLSSTAGIIGTTTNDNAAAGSVGEYISSSVLVGSAVSLTTATTANVTSISLTAGDWDVSGTVFFTSDGSYSGTVQRMGISQTSVTFETIAAEINSSQTNIAFGASQYWGHRIHRYRASLSGTTTIYLIAESTFSAGTVSAYGFIGARRAR